MKTAEVGILLAGVEGGGVALHGRRAAAGDWEFRTSYADQTPVMLDEPEIRRETQWTRDWSEALAHLDREGWQRLPPVMVHPEFRRHIWEAIRIRLTTHDSGSAYRREELLAMWRERCDIDDHAPNDARRAHCAPEQTPEMPIRPVLTARFTDAFQFASVAHACQRRKGTTIPYLSHLMGVASLVLEYCDNEDTAIGALLHDAAEDQGGRPMLEQIRARFGNDVAKIVESCTDTFERKKPDYRPRKQAYIDHLREADPAACLVAAADKLHNARAILSDLCTSGRVVWSRFSADGATLHWFYSDVADVLAQRLQGHPGAALVRELKGVISEIWTDNGQPRKEFQ